MIEAYPLQWPMGYKRTTTRTTSRFEQSAENAQKFLRLELDRLGATRLIVSTNVSTRNDGLIYSDQASAKIQDPGVAIYFKFKGNDTVMVCDRYERVWENIYALGKGIEAIRAMARWGVSDFIEKAFAGFKALPERTEGAAIAWWTILGLAHNSTAEQVKEAYRKLAAQYHPDKETGDSEKFIQVKFAYEQAMSSFS